MALDRLHLIHCEECLRRIEEYTRRGRSAFMASTMVQDAVLWNLEMLAQCAKRVSDAEKAKHPEVPWEKMCGMASGILDHSMRIKDDVVWARVVRDAPELRHSLRPVLSRRA